LIQSDVKAVAVEMRDRFATHPDFEQQGEAWLSTNPLPVPTERERLTLASGEPVYRALLSRR
jgi:tRNA (guanine-N7-)-methyltransferase